ncbi:hypothetical protein K239x_09250 [Planctomycetes bacterium K23_9]|uniref:Uncharacterized protein n=1 Tax=Stieleria marina TaxID=1930275 RepID=A0A517NPC8_9BACT|nr:hypothetical protein K239x_09250 [Planctomycetes bacterium K23_9]
MVFSTLGLSLLIFFVVYTQGHVTGREFSPSHFKSRSFTFYEIPLLHIQITPIRRKSAALAAASYVRQSALINAPKGEPDDWHLVHLSRGLSGATPADAQLLVDQLEMYGDKDTFWRKWSIDHPKHAAVVWPIVQRLATRELYVLIPMVMELAHKEMPVEELSAEIDGLLQRQYRQLIIDMRAAKRGELAQTLLLEALSDYPNDAELNKLRSDAPTPSESIE